MTAENLTSDRVKKAPPPRGKTTSGAPVKQSVIRDAGCDGLELKVSRSGKKTWCVRYRPVQRKGGHGRQRRKIIGIFGTGKEANHLTLAQARTEARAIIGQAADGLDPLQEERERIRVAREQAEREKANTFRALAALYLDKWALGPGAGPRCAGCELCKPKDEDAEPVLDEGHLVDMDGESCEVWDFTPTTGQPRKRTWSEDRRKLLVEINPKIGNKPSEKITSGDVLRLVEGIAYRGAPTQANRVRALLSKVFKFGKGRGLCETNPVTDVEKPHEEQQRKQPIDDDAIRQLWTATDKMDPPLRALFRLLLLTGQRLGEVRGMRWDELDLDEQVWTIPSARTKNKRTHRVPLSEPVVEIIAGLPPIGAQVLHGGRGNRQTYEAAAEIGLEDFQPGRDLRSTALTRMMGAGVSEFDGGQVLNHSPKTVTGKHYNAYRYDREKRMALDALARAIERVVEGRAGADVVPFEAVR